jgi:vacuolar-type H+-ATPase subunit E/Vma4
LGLEELLNTLKKNEQKQIDEIWHAAKSEAEALREQVAEAIDSITRNHNEQLSSACQKSMRSIFSETEIKARAKKLVAYQALDQALQNAAIRQLPVLREHNYELTFKELVDELPGRKWEKVMVSSADLQLAAKFFAVDIIHPDSAISGGLRAVTADGKIIVDNTFEKRLERQWFHIFPAIIAELKKQYEKSGTTENTE